MRSSLETWHSWLRRKIIANACLAEQKAPRVYVSVCTLVCTIDNRPTETVGLLSMFVPSKHCTLKVGVISRATLATINDVISHALLLLSWTTASAAAVWMQEVYINWMYAAQHPCMWDSLTTIGVWDGCINIRAKCKLQFRCYALTIHNLGDFQGI